MKQFSVSFLQIVGISSRCGINYLSFVIAGISGKKKPEISLPTQFEHTMHVGFDPQTGEFTVSSQLFCLTNWKMLNGNLKKEVCHICFWKIVKVFWKNGKFIRV